MSKTDQFPLIIFFLSHTKIFREFGDLIRNKASSNESLAGPIISIQMAALSSVGASAVTDDRSNCNRDCSNSA